MFLRRRLQHVVGNFCPLRPAPSRGGTKARPPIPPSSPFSSGASSSSSSSSFGTSKDFLGIAVFSSICAGAGYLSYWQLERYQWKKQLIKESKERLNSDVYLDRFPLFKMTQRELFLFATKRRGNKILISGKFDHSKEMLLGPRPAPVSATGGAAQGMATNPQGYYVITPFLRDIESNVMYVNRGWIPKDATTWSRPEGLLNVTGVVGEGLMSSTYYLLTYIEIASFLFQTILTHTFFIFTFIFTFMFAVEQKARFSPQHSEELLKNKRLLWLEENSLIAASEYGDRFEKISEDEKEKVNAIIIEELYELPLIKDDKESRTTEKPPKRMLPLAKMSDDFINHSVSPETHMVYAITWASLATIGSAMTFQKFRGGSSNLKKAAKRVTKI